MANIVHNKLVRDKIVTIIRREGKTPVSRVLSASEYKQELRKKLIEEANEVHQSQGDAEEYADVLEVLYAAIEADGYSLDEIERRRTEKAATRGGFSDRVFLEKITDASL